MYRTQSSCTTFGRRHVTTKSRKRWTTSALYRIGSGNITISRKFEEPRAAQPLDQKLIDFHKEKQNFFEKHDVTKMTEQTLMLYYLRDRANKEPHKSGTSEDLQILRELRSEVMHMRASTLPPNLTRNLEARIESQTYEVRSLQRDLQTTQDSLHSWDEVKPHFVSSCLCL